MFVSSNIVTRKGFQSNGNLFFDNKSTSLLLPIGKLLRPVMQCLTVRTRRASIAWARFGPGENLQITIVLHGARIHTETADSIAVVQISIRTRDPLEPLGQKMHHRHSIALSLFASTSYSLLAKSRRNEILSFLPNMYSTRSDSSSPCIHRKIRVCFFRAISSATGTIKVTGLARLMATKKDGLFPAT